MAGADNNKAIPEYARIVIVGGGIMGVGLLYHLAEEGCSDVVLINAIQDTHGVKR